MTLRRVDFPPPGTRWNARQERICFSFPERRHTDRKKKKDIWRNTVQNMFYKQNVQNKLWTERAWVCNAEEASHYNSTEALQAPREVTSIEMASGWLAVQMFLNLQLSQSHCMPIYKPCNLPPMSQWRQDTSLAGQKALPKLSLKHKRQPSRSSVLPFEATARHAAVCRTECCCKRLFFHELVP